MRWNFGGNLRPVRMICEYDWKECPVAVVSYIWSEIVTDVVDSVTGEAHLWRFLAITLLCSMLLHTIYHKTRWMNKSESDFARDHLVKVGFKMQDLELKINILTYKMQYGTWPLPHEIPTPSLNELRNVKLTLSNTSRQNMWTKHHLHGYISKCVRTSNDDKSMTKLLSTNEDVDLASRNYLSKFGIKNGDFETLKYRRNLRLLSEKNNCKDYEKLLRTTNECRKYIDEINESNKSLGLLENSSDISDQNSAKDISAGTESEENSRRFLVDPKKWHEIYKYKNRETEERSESDTTTSNRMFSTLNGKHKNLVFLADEERHPSTNSKRSRLLPPGLSITFLSDKFKTFASSDRCISGGKMRQSKNKASTNETLNKVKEKLESLRDIKQELMKNSKSLNSVYGSLDKKRSEIVLSIKTSSEMNSSNRDSKYEKKELCDLRKFDKLTSSDCDSSSRDNGTALDPIQVSVNKIPAEHKKSCNDRLTCESSNQNVESIFKTVNNSFSKIEKAKNTLDYSLNPKNAANTNLNNIKRDVQNPWRESEETNKNLNVFPVEISLKRCGAVKNVSEIAQGEESLSSENDCSTLFGVRSNSVVKNEFNSHKLFGLDVNEQKQSDSNANLSEYMRNTENNVNLNSTNKLESISKTSMSYVLSPQDKPESQIQMETDEDLNLMSETSSQTELSKGSDTDEKSTTTLLREALEFKKALLMQIQRENEMCEEKSMRNESSECESDETPRSKTDNNFRSKLLDIISEEQSAGSSTEKTSRTYILSRAINETNLCEDPDKYSRKNNNREDLKSNEVSAEGECCGDSKSAVTASSSEYFSINNVTDVEHASAQRLNQCVADGDGVRELEKSSHRQTPEIELQLNFNKNQENNNIAQSFDVELKEYAAKEKEAFFENESQDLLKGLTTIPDVNYIQPLLENNEAINKLEKLVENVEEIDKVEQSAQESCENHLGNTEKQVDSIAEKIGAKSEAKIKFFKSLSSIDSEKGISWNSISESSSTESIAQFINALAKLDSKSIDTIAEQKLMMLNATDYEGRNFAIVGENSGYDFNPRNKKQRSNVSLSEISAFDKNEGVIEEILEMIADSAIFKLERLETIEQSAGNQSEGSNLFNSHGVLKLDQERLQRKQDIFSKLKTLDAFTKPLDISECNSEKNENEGDASPLTGRTVVCTCSSNTKNESESESAEEKGKTLIRVKSDTILNVTTNKTELLSPEKSDPQVLNDELNESEESGKNANTNNGPEDDCKSGTTLKSKQIILTTKRNQLSKSSITNFSTDTSDSYFDMSNHDFAVSSIILTSQNSNFVSNRKDDQAKSDTSSYVDASDQCSKIPSNSNSNLSESQISNTKETGGIKTADEGLEIKDSTAKTILQNNLDSKEESSSVPSNDKKSELKGQEAALIKDQLCAESSISLNQDYSRYWPDSGLEKKHSKARAKSRSCIPVLKSRIDTPRREKSMEAKTRSRSPVRRSNTPTIKKVEGNLQIRAAGSSSNESEKKMRQSIYGSRRSLNRNQSYILPTKNSDIREKCPSAKPDAAEKKESKITRSVSNELTATPEKKPSLLRAPGQLTKECTVIYINIISDADRNETQAVETKDVIKYGNEKDSTPQDKKLDSKCLSLRNLKSDRSSERKSEIKVAGPMSESILCKIKSDNVNNGNEKAAIEIKSSVEVEKEKDSTSKNDLEKMSILSESITNKANKLLSTSTLELSNPVKVDKKEIEISVKPSVKNTSTSVSDFPDASPEKKRSFYNPNKEVFDVSKDDVEKDKIVLSEMLTSDPNFFECRKTHKLYNKLGLGFQEQAEQL